MKELCEDKPVHVRLDILLTFWNPWCAWIEQDTPITRKEVAVCLRNGRERLTETPIWSDILFRKTISESENRERHIQKIAWFVKNRITQPIDIDVGFPGTICGFTILDGNHRLAAIDYKGDEWVLANIMGDIDIAKEIFYL